MNETKVKNCYKKYITNETDIYEVLIKLDKKVTEFYNGCCPLKAKTFSSTEQIKLWINEWIKKYDKATNQI